MSQLVKRAFKYRFYPTPEQARQLARTFGCVRLVYNKALEERRRSHQVEGRTVGYAETSAMLTLWKKTPELAFLTEVSSIPLQQALRHLQTAYNNFFAGRAGRPRYKSRKRGRMSAEYTRSAFRYRAGVLILAKMDRPLNVVWSRPLPEGATPSTVTVSRDAAGRWFVSIRFDDLVRRLPRVDQAVGVDLGLTTLATLSTGEKIVNPRHERAARRRLAKAQKSLSRKQPGSANRQKARRRLAKIHAGIADRRRDLLQQVTTRLVRENQTVVIEDLAVRNMLGNHCAARAIADASWRAFRTMLEYKARWYGRDLVVVDRWFPSTKLCSACGGVAAHLSLDTRSWRCACGARHDRDLNAARNILAAGLAERRNACGADIRPQGETSSPAGDRR